jgi:hypothetical protein
MTPLLKQYINPTTLSIYLLALSGSLFSTVSVAQNEGRWYQVEMLVFKRNPTSTDDELWRKDLILSYPQDARYISNTMPPSVHQLGGHNYTLRRDDNFDVLFHESWQQQMWEESRSPSLIIRGGQKHGGHRELEGTIKIHIGRYLHVSTDLWLSEFIYGAQNNNFQNTSEWLRLPPLPRSSSEANTSDNTAAQQEYQRLFSSEPQPSQIVTLREKRRMRSKETHYIDHPLMGILIRMLPLDTPK